MPAPAWLFQTDRVRAQQLTRADTLALDVLFRRCTTYFLLVQGDPPVPDVASGLCDNRPPEVAAENHFTIGLYGNADILIGLLEALCDYPEAGTTLHRPAPLGP